MAIEVEDAGRLPEIREKAMEMLDQWVDEFIDELNAEEGELEDKVDHGIVLAAWMTATYSMYRHVRSLVEKHGQVVEIPENIDIKA